MSAISGRKGRLYVGLASDSAAAEPVALLKKWSLDLSFGTFDVTAFGDSNKVTVADLPEGKGTYEGFYDTASAQLYTAATDGSARRFYLYPTTDTTTTYFFGTAVFDFSIDTPVDGPVTISGDFEASSVVAKVG